MLYFHYFNLIEPPFSIAPDPRYFFNSARHREALEHLKYGVSETGGFLLLTGEVGTGKTTLCRCLLAQLPEDVDIALILNPRLNAVELLATICDELRIHYPAKTDSLKLLVDALNEYLLSAHIQGRRTVLIIDEAQNLSFEVLEQIRLLTNLETNRAKLLQIILVGQPELSRLLKRRDLRQLTQRITCRYHLKALAFQGTKDYIQHRVAVAGGQAMKLFSLSAVRKIHRLTGGVPRLINLLCDRALNTACIGNYSRVDPEIVKKAARQVRPALGAARFTRPAYWVSGIAAILLATVLGVYESGIWKLSSGIWNKPAAPTHVQATTDILPEQPIVTELAEFNIEEQITMPDETLAENFDEVLLFDENPSASVGEAVAVAETQTIAKLDESEVADELVVKEKKKTVLAPQEVLSKPAFSELISDSTLSYNAAFARVLYRWNSEHTSTTANDCNSVLALGLRCLTQNSNLYFLRRLNRPAILEVFKRGSKRYLTLVAVSDDKLTFDVGGKQLTYFVEEVRSFWRGSFTLLWKPPVPRGNLLRPGQTADAVLWVRQNLASPGEAPIKSSTVDEFFDETLRNRVITFQTIRGLAPDGIVGPHTFMHLNTVNGVPGIPVLEPVETNPASEKLYGGQERASV